MLRAIQIIAVICLANCANAQEMLGVMNSFGSKPIVYSVSKLNCNIGYRAFEINSLAACCNVSISSARRNADSPLYAADGDNHAWLYDVSTKKELSRGVWLVLPASWKVDKISDVKGTAVMAHGRRGSITITKRSEGVEIAVTVNNKTNKVLPVLREMPNPRHSEPIVSLSFSRITNRTRSFITERSFHGILLFAPLRAEKCNPCLRNVL